jgi:hypothetical protein
MLDFSSICRKNAANLVGKKRLKKSKDCHFQSLSVLNMQKKYLFVSIIEHMNFAINEKYSKDFYDNLNCYVSLVIYQTYENVILRNVHSFRWLF